MDKLPEYYCPNCSAVVYEDEAHCFECAYAKPDGGWLPLGLAGDMWLGRVLSERYLVTRQVAASQRARVYIADSRIIPRSFAVKIMNVSTGPNLDEEGLRKRLRREVEALGTLRNPHIVSFYDVFDAGDEHVAFVMDWVDGVTLDELIAAEGKLEPWRAVVLARQIANGLFEAHERNLLHRDLKPNNVMVEKLPIGDDFVRILDFGVMWVRGTALGTGAFDSVPVYSSPEQIADEEVDQRGDLYSLGGLLFFMLTGEPPFDPENLADPELILVEPPPTLEDVTGEVYPAQLEALVARLLAKDPAQRPDDVGVVLNWLDEIGDEIAGFESEPSVVPTEASDAMLQPWEDAPSDATAFGMVHTLGEASSPVLRIEASEMSQVSEASVDPAHDIELMACRGEGYGYVQGLKIIWAGAFDGTSPATLDPSMRIVSLAVCAHRAILGTADGRILLARPGEEAITAFQDPRLAAMPAVAIVADGTAMIAGSAAGRLYMNRGDDFVRMGGGDEAISSLCLNERGDQFAVARGSTIQVLSVAASNFSTFPSPLAEPVISMAFSPDDYLVAVLTDSGTVVLESVHTGQEFMRLETSDPNLRALTFSSDNHLMGLFRDGDRVVLRALT